MHVSFYAVKENNSYIKFSHDFWTDIVPFSDAFWCFEHHKTNGISVILEEDIFPTISKTFDG